MTRIITLDGDIFNKTKTQREIKHWMVSFTVPLLTERLSSTLVVGRSPLEDTECGDQSPPARLSPPPSCGLTLPTASLQKLAEALSARNVQARAVGMPTGHPASLGGDGRQERNIWKLQHPFWPLRT